MRQLLSIARIDGARLRSILSNVEVAELSNLALPCYFPQYTAYYSSLLEVCQLTETDIDRLAQRTWQGRKESNWIVAGNPASLFFVLALNQTRCPFTPNLLCLLFQF